MTGSQVHVSIIICTHNRAEHLRPTLASLASICVPSTMSVELIVVDNASTDDTQKVVEGCAVSQMMVHYIREPRQGQCYARNSGIAAALGDVILFTDDDIRFPKDWISGMCNPILSGKADAVAGGVRFAAHLLRDWMTLEHRTSLASTERMDPLAPQEMVGANMAFARRVLEKVPEFDVDLGPGALGYGDDTLFTFQLKEAGYKLMGALDTEVEHHFDSSRLTRQSFLAAGKKFGKASAYITYHWSQTQVPRPHLRLAKRTLRLLFWRLRFKDEIKSSEGIPLWESVILTDIHFYREYLRARSRPVLYEKRGLIKRVVKGRYAKS